MKMTDKYLLYEASVQSPESDIEFIEKEYQTLYGSKPTELREDFCGTGKLIYEWVQLSDEHKGLGIDLSTEPIESGRERYWEELNTTQKKRMKYVQGDVLKSEKHASQVVCAFNYSYCIFKDRSVLKKYFEAVRKSMPASGGMFVLDCFGGTESMMEGSESRTVESKKLGNFKYYWECERFNPLTHECFFSIHFKEKGQKKRKQVYTYDWRLWSTPELVDLLSEVGFSNIQTYWEGDDEDGGGDGEFKATREAENCLAWISYIVATP